MRTGLLALAAVATLVGTLVAAPAPPVRVGELLEVRMAADNPLRGRLVVGTRADSRVTVDVRGPDGSGRRVRVERPGARTTTVPLLELRPETTYTVTSTVDGVTAEREVTTGPLPAFFPPIEAGGTPATAGGGVTLMDVRFWGGSEQQRAGGDGWVVALDGAGEVVWYLRTPLTQEDVERTPAGNLVFTYNEGAIRRYTPSGVLLDELAGRVPRELVAEDAHGHPSTGEDPVGVAVDQMHHEVVQLDDGNYLTLDREVREVSGFPEPICEDDADGSGSDPATTGTGQSAFDGTYTVGGDAVVEIDPATGEVVRRWSTFDYASPLDHLDRIPPDGFCGTYLDRRYPQRAPVRDWTHANGLAVDERRNLVLVSLRHLDQLWALRWRDDADGPAGELLWRMGPGGDIALTAGSWFRHQHAPEFQPDGSLLVYDNGNHRPGTAPGSASPPYSRVVRYELDLERRTATQVWDHRTGTGDGPVYAPFLGDADRLANGDVLITHGGAVQPPRDEIFAPGVDQYARIVQVDPATGRAVWRATVRDASGQLGWSVYRAERVATLYPAGFDVRPLP